MIAVEAPGTTETWADPGAAVADAYHAYAAELGAYVARSFGGRVTPEDIVHEAFARLVRDVAAGRAPVFVRPWLYRVAHNLAIDELRRPARFEPEPGEERAPAAWSPSAEVEAETWSLSPELRQALASLPRAGRTTIVMAADGYTGREIAAAVGRSELATRALLCRTRRMLRCLLAGAGAAGADMTPRLAA
jgi:RNA polymerase sigma-70 factor (ECF subfamily)